MASPIAKKLAKHLECPICLEKFEEPKVLSCQHSYCRKCLERLVVGLGGEDYEVTCPECRKKTKVPGDDVKSLPSNFLINNLLSLHDDGQSEKITTCAKHDGEELKLFCQTCEQPICRDCTVIDHQAHKYSFIKDVFVSERQKILQIVQQSKENISALETAVATITAQESKLQENEHKVCECVDSFINAQIEMLTEKGKNLKEELKGLNLIQEENFFSQKDSLFLSLGCLKSSVEFTERALSKGDEVAVLTAKSQLSRHLKQAAVLSAAKPRDTVFHCLEIDAPIDNETVEKLGHISKFSEGYKLSIFGGNFGQLDETYVNNECSFVISVKKGKTSDFSCNMTKCKRLNLENSVSFYQRKRYDDNLQSTRTKYCAQVRIKSPNSMNFQSTVIEGDEDGFYFFYCPLEVGTYAIEVIINGQYIQGCPFSWIVKEFKIARQYTKMDDEE